MKRIMYVLGVMVGTMLLQKGFSRGDIALCILGAICGGTSATNIIFKND